jgi:hypothetical protein
VPHLLTHDLGEKREEIVREFRYSIGTRGLSLLPIEYLAVMTIIRKTEEFKQSEMCTGNLTVHINLIACRWKATQQVHWAAHFKKKLTGNNTRFAARPSCHISSDAAEITGTVREILLLAILLSPSVPLSALTPFNLQVATELLQARVHCNAAPVIDLVPFPPCSQMGHGMMRDDLYARSAEWDEVTEYMNVKRDFLVGQKTFEV